MTFLDMSPEATLDFPDFLRKMKHETEIVKVNGVHFWEGLAEEVLEQEGWSEDIASVQVTLLAAKISHDTQNNIPLWTTLKPELIDMLCPTLGREAMWAAVIADPTAHAHLEMEMLERIAEELKKKEKGSAVLHAFYAFPAGRKMIHEFSISLESKRKRGAFVGVVERAFGALEGLNHRAEGDETDFDYFSEATAVLTPMLQEFARAHAPWRPRLAGPCPLAPSSLGLVPQGLGLAGPGVRSPGARARGHPRGDDEA